MPARGGPAARVTGRRPCGFAAWLCRKRRAGLGRRPEVARAAAGNRASTAGGRRATPLSSWQKNRRASRARTLRDVAPKKIRLSEIDLISTPPGLPGRATRPQVDVMDSRENWRTCSVYYADRRAASFCARFGPEPVDGTAGCDGVATSSRRCGGVVTPQRRRRGDGATSPRRRRDRARTMPTGWRRVRHRPSERWPTQDRVRFT